MNLRQHVEQFAPSSDKSRERSELILKELTREAKYVLQRIESVADTRSISFLKRRYDKLFNEIWKLNEKQILYVVNKSKGRNLEDAMQIAGFVVHKSILSFNPELGVKFSTYLIVSLKRALYREILGGEIYVPVEIRRTLKCIKLCIDSLKAQFGRVPSVDEVRKKLEKEKRFTKNSKFLVEVMNRDPNKEMETEEYTFVELVTIAMEENPKIARFGEDTQNGEVLASYDGDSGFGVDMDIEGMVDFRRKEEEVKNALAKFDERSREMFSLHYLGEKTLQEIGDRYGVSRQRVWKICTEMRKAIDAQIGL